MQQKQKYQKQSNSSEDEDPREQSQQPSQSASSTSTLEYDQYLKIHKIIPFFQNVCSFEAELKDNKITYNENIFCEQPTLIIKSHSTNYQILHLLVAFSHFTFDIQVLNLPNKSSPILEFPKQIGVGAMGAVKKIQESKGKQFVIKIIKHSTKQLNENSKTLRSSIVEFCMNKLFSVFKIGPHVGQDYLGFDAIIYDESVVFATQFCQNITNIEQTYHCLLSKLISMHQLKIIHGDIKPQNLMFSKKYDGPVFIDFGLSKSIIQKKGLCTFTQFFGTFQYVSPKMKELFFEKKFGELDLYYNDFHCLKEAMKEVQSDIQNMKICIVQQKQTKRLKPDEVMKMSQVQQYLSNIRLQKIILTRNCKEVKNYLMENEKFQILQSTIEILEELNLTAGIKKIGKVIKEHFFLDEGLAEIVDQICHHEKFYHEGLKPKKLEKLSKRLKQSFSSQNMALTEMMLTLYFFFNQDVTSRAQLQKKIMKENILSLKPSDSKFWMSLVDFSSNFFTSKTEIIEIFNYIGNKLEIEWKEEQNNFYEVYSKSWKLCSVAFKKYNISICSLLKEREGASQSSNLFGSNVNLQKILSKYQESKVYKSHKFTKTKVFQQLMEILLHYSQNKILAEQMLSKMNCIKKEIDMNNETDGFELIVNQFIFDVSFVLKGPNTSFCFEEIQDSYRNYGYPEKIKPIVFSLFKKIYYNMFYVAKKFTNVAQQCMRLQDLSFNYCFEIGPILELFILTKIILKIFDFNFNIDELEKKFNEIRQNFEILGISSHISILLKWCYRITELLKKSLKRSTDQSKSITWMEDMSMYSKIYKMIKITQKFVVDMVYQAQRFGKLDDRTLLFLVTILNNNLIEFKDKYQPNNSLLKLAHHVTGTYPQLTELTQYTSSYEYIVLSIKHHFVETEQFYEAVKKLQVRKFPKITNYCECQFYHLLICLKIKRKEDASNQLRQLIMASMVAQQKFQSLIKVSHSLIDFLSISLAQQTDNVDEFFGYFLEIIRQSSKSKSNSHFLQLYINCIQMGKVIFVSSPQKDQDQLLRKPLQILIKAFRVQQNMNNQHFVSNFSNSLPLLEIIIELMSKNQRVGSVSQEFRTELRIFLIYISLLAKNSFSLAKWRMRNKFYFILLFLIRKEFMAMETPPKMLLYIIHRFRNSQYEIPFEDEHIQQILNMKKIANMSKGIFIEDTKNNRSFVKVLALAERKISDKLKTWNQNKNEERKIDVLEDFAITFADQSLYSEILNEVSPNSDQLFRHLRKAQHIKLLHTEKEEEGY